MFLLVKGQRPHAPTSPPPPAAPSPPHPSPPRTLPEPLAHSLYPPSPPCRRPAYPEGAARSLLHPVARAGTAQHSTAPCSRYSPRAVAGTTRGRGATAAARLGCALVMGRPGERSPLAVATARGCSGRHQMNGGGRVGRWAGRVVLVAGEAGRRVVAGLLLACCRGGSSSDRGAGQVKWLRAEEANTSTDPLLGATLHATPRHTLHRTTLVCTAQHFTASCMRVQHSIGSTSLPNHLHYTTCMM